MRPLEIFLLVCVGLHFVVGWFNPRRALWRLLFPLAGGVALLLHLALEGYRWQMLPAYALLLLLIFWQVLVLLLRRNPVAAKPKPLSAGRMIVLSLGLLLTGLLTLPPALFPVPSLPAPGGAFRVGTVDQQLVDSARRDPYAPTPDTPRRLMVQIWYPAQPPPGAQTGRWMAGAEIVAPAIAAWIGLPTWALDHLALARTNAVPSAPFAETGAARPVLLFSHGFGGFRAQSTYLMEELASHGYVVVAVEHTYASVATVFPDGSVAAHNPQTLPGDLQGDAYARAANQLVTQWAQDLAFVLDWLATVNAADPAGRFTGQLDLTRVGVFGHSTGGAAMLEFCAADARCRAGLALDAFLTPVASEVIASGPTQPLLFVYSELWQSARNRELSAALVAGLPTPPFYGVIQGTAHYDFTDLPLLSPLAPALGLKGPLEGSQVLALNRRYAVAFFDYALRGDQTALPVLTELEP